MVTQEQRITESDRVTVGFICLLCFIGGVIINPSHMFYSLQPLRLQFFFAIAACVGLLANLQKKSTELVWTRTQTFYTLFTIAGIISLSNLVGSQLLEVGIEKLSNSLKTWLMIVVISSSCSKPRLLRICFKFFLVMVGLFQLHCLKAIFAGVSVYGRFDSWVGQISNADNLGAFFAIMAVMQLELFVGEKKNIRKVMLLASSLVSIFIMVKTQTRGAVLALAVMFVLWVFKTDGRKVRVKASILVLCCFLLFGNITSAQTEYEGGFFGRMRSMFSEEARESDGGIQSRLYLWEQGIRIWTKFPLFGCGVGGMSPHQEWDAGSEYAGVFDLTKHSIHHAFIQVLAERGTIGGIIYGLFIISIFQYLSKIGSFIKDSELDRYFKSVSSGLQLGMVGFVAGGMFMSIQESWILIFFASFTSALYELVRSRSILGTEQNTG